MSIDFEGAFQRCAAALLTVAQVRNGVNVTVDSMDLKMVLMERAILMDANRMLGEAAQARWDAEHPGAS